MRSVAQLAMYANPTDAATQERYNAVQQAAIIRPRRYAALKMVVIVPEATTAYLARIRAVHLVRFRVEKPASAIIRRHRDAVKTELRFG